MLRVVEHLAFARVAGVRFLPVCKRLVQAWFRLVLLNRFSYLSVPPNRGQSARCPWVSVCQRQWGQRPFCDARCPSSSPFCRGHNGFSSVSCVSCVSSGSGETGETLETLGSAL